LLIFGDRDKITPVAAGKIFEKFLQNGKLAILKNATHKIHRENADFCAQKIGEFLEKNI